MYSSNSLRFTNFRVPTYKTKGQFGCFNIEVKEEAFRAAQAMGITYRGNPIRLGRKDIGFKTKDFTKVFLRIKREKSMEELDLYVFKEAFKTIAAEMYDVMEFEKGQKFDDWIANTYKCLPKK